MNKVKSFFYCLPFLFIILFFLSCTLNIDNNSNTTDDDIVPENPNADPDFTDSEDPSLSEGEFGDVLIRFPREAQSQGLDTLIFDDGSYLRYGTTDGDGFFRKYSKTGDILLSEKIITEGTLCFKYGQILPNDSFVLSFYLYCGLQDVDFGNGVSLAASKPEGMISGIIKYDKSGKALWIKACKSLDESKEVDYTSASIKGVKAGKNGDIFILWDFNYTTGIDFGDGVPIINDLTDHLDYQSNYTISVIEKRNSEGELCWRERIMDSTQYSLDSLNNSSHLLDLMECDSNDTIYVAYYDYKSDIINSNRYYVFRISEDGTKKEIISENVKPFCFFVNEKNNFFIAGQKTKQAVILKFDSSGNLEKELMCTPEKGYDENLSDDTSLFTGIGIDSEDNIYLCGEMYRYGKYDFGNNISLTNPDNIKNFMLVKIDSNLNALWAKSSLYAYGADLSVKKLFVNDYGIYLTGKFVDIILSVGGRRVDCTSHNMIHFPEDQDGTEIEFELTERQVLNIVYTSLKGEKWTNSENWGSDKPLSEWFGITTDENDSVTGIELSNNSLSGKMTMYFYLLKNLKKIDFSGNQVSLSLPEELPWFDLELLNMEHTNGMSFVEQILTYTTWKNGSFNISNIGYDRTTLPEYFVKDAYYKQNKKNLITGNNFYYPGESEDYSKNNTYKNIHPHKKGNGSCYFVLVGDGFIDVDLDESYDEMMLEICSYIFNAEPYKSLEDYFDVYLLYLVSKHRTVPAGFTSLSSTPLNSRRNKDSFYGNADFPETAINILVKNEGIDKSNVAVLVIPNCEYEDFYFTPACTTRFLGKSSFTAVAVIQKNYFDMELTVQHELCGHGWGQLADEYYCTNTIDLPLWQSYDYLLNVFYNPEFQEAAPTEVDVPWAHFFADEFYKDKMSIIKGYYNDFVVYRPEKSSIMTCNSKYFSAYSRELIYKRVMKLNEIEVTFEDFKEFDKNIALEAYESNM